MQGVIEQTGNRPDECGILGIGDINDFAGSIIGQKGIVASDVYVYGVEV